MRSILYKYFPILIFLFIWISVINLHSLGLFNVKGASWETYQLLYFGIFSIALSYLLSVVYDLQFSTFFQKKWKINVDTNLLAKITISLSVICVVGGILTIYVISNNLGGFDVFINRPLMVRQEVVNIAMGRSEAGQLYRFASYLVNIGFLSVIFGGILFACRGKYRLLGLIPIVAVLFSQLAVLGRYRFTTALVFFLGSYLIFTFFQKKEIQIKRIIEISLLTSLSLLIVIALSYLVMKLRSPLADNITEIVKESGYTYFTGGVTALDVSLNSEHHSRVFGQYSFRSIFRWIERLGFISRHEVVPVHNPFVSISPNYNSNTYTFVRSIYLDFGVPGLLVITSLWGFLSKHFLFKAYYNFSLINVLLANIFLFSLIISFFSFYFQSFTGIIFWIIIMYFLNKLYNNRLFKISEI